MVKDKGHIVSRKTDSVYRATLLVHAGKKVDESTGALALPIHMSTNFERDKDENFPKGYFYSTFGNPNRSWLEQAVMELEGGRAAVATSSGMAAIACVLSVVAPGERVLVPNDLFQGTARLLNDQFCKWGIDVDYFDATPPQEIESQIYEKTRMVWLDTPSNPLLRISDIAKIAKITRSRGLWLAVDSTLATFAIQQPLKLGADVVVHAATKFIAGHSDVVQGLAIFRERSELYEVAKSFRTNLGAVPSPMDCWLVQRGLATLWVRIHKQSQSAHTIARWLQRRREVERVYYPGLESHEHHLLAREQMNGVFGGILSFSLRGGTRLATELVNNVALFTRASSLGGNESLIEHRSTSPIQNLGTGTGLKIPEGLIRLSIGLEEAVDLIDDLEQAFASLVNSKLV